MNQYGDQILAKRMLQVRDEGFTFGLYLRQRAKIYLISLLSFALVLAWLVVESEWMAIYFFTGMAAGYVLRDYSRYRTVAKALPFSRKVTDWKIVEELAAGATDNLGGEKGEASI